MPAPRLVILTYYFPPDFAAGAFRMDAMVRALRSRLPDCARIDVVTAQPHRYKGQQAVDSVDGSLFGTNVAVHRLNARGLGGGSGSGLSHFASFAIRAAHLVQRLRPDVILGSSSRLGTAALAAELARLTGADLHLDMRDCLPDNFRALYPRAGGGVWGGGLNLLQWRTLRRARFISVTAPVYGRYLARHGQQQAIYWLPNGVDADFRRLGEASSVEGGVSGRVKRIVYAGNVGKGQALERILPELAEQTQGIAEWRIIGDGGSYKALQRLLNERQVGNVSLIPPQPRAMLEGHYDWADVLFLHLSSARAMQRVIPSKFFEYAATGKPVVAGARGYLARFLRAQAAGVWCFPPGDAASAVQCINAVDHIWYDRSRFRERFDRGALMRPFCDAFLDRFPVLLGEPSGK